MNSGSNEKRKEWRTKLCKNRKNITKNNVAPALKKSPKQKSPGNDKVPNFWFCHLSSFHKTFTQISSMLVNNPKEIPKWITEGITYILAKRGETDDPMNYRPITCLPTTYKLISSVLTSCTYTLLDENILPL